MFDGEVEAINLLSKAKRTAMIRDGVKMLLPAAGQGSDEWLGFRPSMPDSLPVIGSSRHLPRVTYAFGHGHLGLTLSALTGSWFPNWSRDSARLSIWRPCVPTGSKPGA